MKRDGRVKDHYGNAPNLVPLLIMSSNAHNIITVSPDSAELCSRIKNVHFEVREPGIHACPDSACACVHWMAESDTKSLTIGYIIIIEV